MQSSSENPLPPDNATTLGESAQPLAYRVVRGSLVVALSSYGMIIWGFVANLILTRLLDPEDFGQYALATFFFALLNLKPKIGVDSAFAQRTTTQSDLIGTHLVVSLTAGIATLVLAIIAVPIILALGYSQTVILLMLTLAVIGISDAMMGTAWILLDKHLLFARSSWLIAFAFVSSYFPAFVLAVNRAGVWSLVAQNATYAFLLLLGLWILCRRQLPTIWRARWSFHREIAQELIRFGIPVGIATVSGTLLFQFDNFLVGTFVGMTALGFYDRAHRIAQWPHLLVSSLLTRVSFYVYAQLQKDAERISKVVTLTLWLITRSALPLATAIFIAAPDLVVFLWGERWLESAFMVRLLVVYSALRPLLDDAGSFFIATGHPERHSRIVLTQAIMLVLVATPFTLLWGIIGTAIGVGIAFAAGLVLTYFLIRQRVNFSLYHAFGTPLIAMTITLVAYAVSTLLFDWNALWLVGRVGLKLTLGSLGFVMIVFALEPRATLENIRYVWRLAYAKP